MYRVFEWSVTWQFDLSVFILTDGNTGFTTIVGPLWHPAIDHLHSPNSPVQIARDDNIEMNHAQLTASPCRHKLCADLMQSRLVISFVSLMVCGDTQATHLDFVICSFLSCCAPSRAPLMVCFTREDRCLHHRNLADCMVPSLCPTVNIDSGIWGEHCRL